VTFSQSLASTAERKIISSQIALKKVVGPKIMTASAITDEEDGVGDCWGACLFMSLLIGTCWMCKLLCNFIIMFYRFPLISVLRGYRQAGNQSIFLCAFAQNYIYCFAKLPLFTLAKKQHIGNT
jgi:hypothetical protein